MPVANRRPPRRCDGFASPEEEEPIAPPEGAAQFFAIMFVMFLARAAYFKDMVVSSTLEVAGEQFTNMSVLAVPPRESCISWVSLWFL